MKFFTVLLLTSAALVSAIPAGEFENPTIPNPAQKKVAFKEYAPFVQGECVPNRFYCSKHLPTWSFPKWLQRVERQNTARVFYCQPGERGEKNEIVEYSMCDTSVEKRWCEVFNKGRNYQCWRKDMGRPMSSLIEQSATAEDRRTNTWEKGSGIANAGPADTGTETIDLGA